MSSTHGGNSTATVTIKIGETITSVAATGHGPVNALDLALRRP
jgi:hypothetical protein